MKLYEEMKKYTELVEQGLEGFTVMVLFNLVCDGDLWVKIYARRLGELEYERGIMISALELTTAKCDILEQYLLSACAAIRDAAATS